MSCVILTTDLRKQKHSSSNTSVNSSKLPVVYKRAALTSNVVFDIGCGKFIDHIRKHLGDRQYFPYDPFNQPESVNMISKANVMNCISDHIPVDVICSNVLNVICEEDVIKDITGTIDMIVNSSGGTGYVTVYEGNRSGIGKQTGPNQYQRNEKLKSYLQYFRRAEIEDGMIVVRAN